MEKTLEKHNFRSLFREPLDLDDENVTSQELGDLRKRIERIEEDISSLLLIQNQVLTTINDLQTSIFKLRDSLLRVRDRIG